MRIATSTTYTQQATAIDNLETQWQNQGNMLSTGRALNAPSDDPTQIARDLDVRSTITVQTQAAVNIQAATAQLTSADTALANLTSILQTTRQIATAGATDLVSPSDRKNMAEEVDQYLQQAIAVGNTQYGGTFLFAGSVQSSTAPLSTTGSPASAVVFSGNEQSAAPLLFNGQSFSLAPTLQQAFNQGATNGSPSVFQTLITLRDTLDKGLVKDESSQSINHAADVIYGAGSPPTLQTTLGTTPSPFLIAPVADSAGSYTISINNTDASGKAHVNAYTFSAATTVDDATVATPNNASAASIVGAINAKNTGPNASGISAAFDAQTQRFVLTNAGGGSFSVADTPSSGAKNTSNLSSVFQLAGSATLPQTISTQLGDIDDVLNVTLNARALVGTRINALATINTQVSTDATNNLGVQSGIEDTDVAKVTTEFSATQTALTASYSTTSRLESKTLFDYL